jgi:hypothetical protein
MLADFNKLIRIFRCNDDTPAPSYCVRHADKPGVSIEELHCSTEFFLFIRYSIKDLCNQQLELSQRDEVFLFECCLGRREIGRKLSY